MRKKQRDEMITDVPEFALAYDGKGLEPLDRRGLLVDMNGDGIRGRRETLEQAWSRLKLLKAGEKLTRSKYVSCVRGASAKLVKEGFLPSEVAVYYVKAAAESHVGEAGR